jgi:hypothetical protein
MGAKQRSKRAVPDEEPQGVDVLRVRISDGTAFVWLPSPEGMGRVEAWGYLLCEAMLHIANAYRLSAGYDFDRTLDRIQDALQQRLRHDLRLYGGMCDN